MIQENNEWNVLHVTFHIPNPWDTSFYTITYRLSHDTVINNQPFFKLLKSEGEFPIHWQYEGALREKDQKVWFLPKFGTEEELIYDFSIKVGDTIAFLYEPMVVDSIVFRLINGEYRKHWFFSYPGVPFREFWIEGIGSNRGVLQSGNAGFVGGWTWLLCMYENSSLIYMNPAHNSCSLFSTGIEETGFPVVRFSSNTSDGYIMVEYPEDFRITHLSVISLSGRTVRSYATETKRLDISGMSSGIFFLKLVYEGGVTIRKFVIH